MHNLGGVSKNGEGGGGLDRFRRDLGNAGQRGPLLAPLLIVCFRSYGLFSMETFEKGRVEENRKSSSPSSQNRKQVLYR